MFSYLMFNLLIPGIFYSSFTVAIIATYICISSNISRGNIRMQTDMNYTVTTLIALIIFFVWLESLIPLILKNISILDSLYWMINNISLIIIVSGFVINILYVFSRFLHYLDATYPFEFKHLMFGGATVCLVGMELILLYDKYMQLE